MSEVLARIRIKEEHGIRRFLYPLQVEATLPSGVFPSQMNQLALTNTEGVPAPFQVTSASGRRDEPQRLDFAVSLAPHAQEELRLLLGEAPLVVDDPLNFTPSVQHEGIRSTQRRFALTLDYHGSIHDVVYDSVPHLRGPSTLLRNGMPMSAADYQDLTGEELLAAWTEVEGQYTDDCQARTRIELTACKSWATMTHTLNSAAEGDEVVFRLPLAVSSSPLTYDFGVGGGIYGKLQRDGTDEVLWKTKFEGNQARWSLATAGRKDYVGQSTRQEFRPQRWFHLIDSDKALAVAITELPEACREMMVSLNIQGDAAISFRLGEKVPESVVFGVCYHFLNDIPAIAAATNPQSILLPPNVEVLPA